MEESASTATIFVSSPQKASNGLDSSRDTLVLWATISGWWVWGWATNHMCKLTSFVTNTTACYINWLWAAMFAQRYVHVFLSKHSVESGSAIFRYFSDARKVILHIGVMSILASAWAPVLTKELFVYNAAEEVVGSYCGPDSTVVDKDVWKWIALVDAIWTYAAPLAISVVAQLASLALAHYIKRDTSALSPMETSLTPLNIQAKANVRAYRRPRQREIRRCLLIATTQLFLNMPNYVLQLIDEFTSLKSTSQRFVVTYFYCDAIFYVFYLIQFPMLAMYVRWLHSDHTNTDEDRRASRRPKKGKLPLPEESTNKKQEFCT